MPNAENYAKYKDDILKYHRETLKQVKFALNRNTEPELIDWIESQPNKQAYLRELIYKDMMRHRIEGK